MGTLADLVQGFQGGYTGVQDARRRRKLNQAIDYELGHLEEKRQHRQDAREKQGYGDVIQGADFTMPQTWGEKLLGKVKGFFGGSDQRPEQAINPNAGQRTPHYAQGIPRFASGGPVRKMANGGRSVMADRSSGVPAQKSSGHYHVENPIPGFTDGGMALPTAPGQLAPQNMGQAIPTPNRMMMAGQRGAALPGFADGGAVPRLFDEEGNRRELTPEEIMQRSYGEYYVTEEEAAANRAARSQGKHRNRNPYHQRYEAGVDRRAIFADQDGEGGRFLTEDVPRAISSQFDDTVSGALGGQKLIDAADAELAKAEGAREVGSATRRTGTAALTAAGETTGGLLKDVFVDNPITQGALGFLGYTGEDGAQPAEQAAAQEAVAPEAASQPNVEDPPGTRTAKAQNQAQPAGPDDPIIDFSQESAREIMPEDMPNHGVKDWEDERRYWAAYAITMGNDPFDAMRAVDQRQMRGFQQYGQQAHQLMLAGDMKGAANALYAAYQYFPNGTDVRFGVQKGKDGRPILMGMGTNEETGESVGVMPITPESLAVQLENMANPSAFRTWTRDWRAAEQEIRRYNELEKPLGQSRARAQDRSSRAALLNAQASYNRSTRSGGGLDQGDLDRANAAFLEAVELEGFDNPEQADAMMDMMSQIYSRYAGRVQYPTVIRDVRDAIRSGNLDALDQKYGQQ